MESYIEEFLNTMRVDGASKCTISAYLQDLKEFCSFFGGTTIEGIMYSDIRDWASEMERRGLSASTRTRHISCIKSFFSVLGQRRGYRYEPGRSLVRSKSREKAACCHNEGTGWRRTVPSKERRGE